MGKTIAQSWVEEGIAIGIERGIERGRTKTLRDVISSQGRKRFGEPSAEVQKTLQAMTDAGRLQVLSDRILDVNTWEELLTDLLPADLPTRDSSGSR